MSVAFKVAGSERMYMSTHPTGSTSPAKLRPILKITGYWPWYETTVYCLGKDVEKCKHFGRKALTAYLICKRMEEEHVVHDERKLWK